MWVDYLVFQFTAMTYLAHSKRESACIFRTTNNSWPLAPMPPQGLSSFPAPAVRLGGSGAGGANPRSRARDN